MGTNDGLKTKPPLPPKPQIKEGIPQKALDSRPSSTNTTNGAQSRPTPQPRLHKPCTLKHTLNQAGDTQTSLCNTDDAASNRTSESYSVLSACPPCCPCVCHNASKNGPKKTEQHENNYIISSENKNNKELKRVPPDVPVPARPLPKEPWQMTVMSGGTADDNEGVYAEAEIPDDTAPIRNEPESSGAALKVPSKKSIPTARKLGKKKMVTHKQSKYQDNEHVIFESLINELCQIHSCETKKKPKTMKNVLDKIMFSEEVDGSQPQSCYISFKKEKNAGKLKNKLSTLVKPPSTIFSSSPSQSFPTSAKCPKQSNAAMLPSSVLKIKRTRSSSIRKTKNKDGNSQKMLQERLWQERSVVKESGILNKLTKEELLLQESIYEVATSEHSYLERLTVVVNHFLESPELKSAVAPRDQKSLFSSMQKMREISQNFLDSMVQSLGSSLFSDILCDVVHNYAAGPFNAYVDYIRNMACQKHTLIKLRNENPLFVEILKKLQEDPCCNRLTLESFLSLPFQRISHLKVLMETVLKRTASKSDVQASAEAALTEISKVLEVCNREVGKMTQIEELVNFANKIEFECKTLPLVSSSRWLIRYGEMTQLALNENIFGQKKNCPVHLILFNDLLLVASKKGSDRYVVHDHVHRSLIDIIEGDKVEDDLEGYDVSRVFLLAILKNHRGISYQLLFQASTLEERDSWLKVLRSEEGVYEEWDCPRVRCIQAYDGRQAGELSLQPEDIVSIIQKTSDDLMEGRRLPDGQRGWFPARCVMEIFNEHVQRRNLHQHHHVLQAAESIPKRNRACQDQRTTTCFNKL